MGLWREDVIQVENGFGDDYGLLDPVVQREYNYRKNSSLIRVSSGKVLGVKSGQQILVKPPIGPSSVQQLHSIKLTDDGKHVYELGNRTLNNKDLWQASGVNLSDYTDYYIHNIVAPKTPSSAITFYPTDATHSTSTWGSWGSIKINAFTKSQNPRVLLDGSVSLDGDLTEDDDPRRFFFLLKVNGAYGLYTVLDQFQNGQSFSDMDITDLLTWNSSSNTITMMMGTKEDFASTHSHAYDHPQATCSLTLRQVDRRTGVNPATGFGLTKKPKAPVRKLLKKKPYQVQ